MLRLFLSLPAVGYFILAALLFGAGIYLENIAQSGRQERALALEGPMPGVIDLGTFERADKGLGDEVNIAAQINTSYNYTLYKGDDGETKARVMWVLFDPASTEDDKIARAAIVIPHSDADTLTNWLFENVHGEGQISPVFHFNGTYDGSVPYDDVAEDAMDDEGLVRAPGFFYIEPFINGREAGLSPRNTDQTSLMTVGSVLALILAAFGGLKMKRRRGRRVI